MPTALPLVISMFQPTMDAINGFSETGSFGVSCLQ